MAEHLTKHESVIDTLTAHLLDRYVASLPSDPVHKPHRAPKDFNDPVWGTIILAPFEVTLIDSPLIQRLRGIRQLGVAHLIYPAAVHTRFEHVIGTSHLVEQLALAVNRHADSEVISRALFNTLRLAAISHDIGHGVMSHVSENAARDFSPCRQIVQEFADEVAPPKRTSLSEINAYLMVGSPSFRSLMDRLRVLYPAHAILDDPIMAIQRAIIGMPIDATIPLAQEFITGPFDADKLDYMKRDAYMSGVPVVTDVTRLVQKVRSVTKSIEQLPAELARTVDPAKPVFNITGMSFSGARTLDELMLGRILLFDKIYRHQKIRACEAMISSMLRLVVEATGVSIGTLMLSLSDSQITPISITTIANISEAVRDAGGQSEVKQEPADLAIKLSRDFALRELWVRAYAFAQNMPFDGYRWDRAHAAGLRRLLQHDSRVNARDLAATIGAEAGRVMSVLDIPLPDGVSVERIKDVIEFDAPIGPPEPDDSAYLISSDDQLVRFQDEYAETRAWTKAYHITRDVGYIFAPNEIAPFVFIAAEKVFRDEYNIRTPPLALSYSHLSADHILALKRQLEALGYYEDAPYDVRPLTETLRRGDFNLRCEQVVKKLEGYCGPVRGDTARDKATLRHKDRIVSWIHQFRDEALAEEALKVVENVKHIDRNLVIGALEAFLSPADSNYRSAAVVPLGEPKDSSAILTYYANDLSDRYGISAMSLADALQLDRPILFVDDFVGTGSQAISVVEAWLGEPPTTQLSEERHPLDDGLKEMLREAEHVAFVFASGTAEGRDAFSERLAQLGLSAEVVVCETDLPRLAQLGLSDEFIAACREIGMELLDDGQHPVEWREERALGYGNEGVLVVFSHNTPAQTVTCLWAENTVQGFPWVPLFPRRKKR